MKAIRVHEYHQLPQYEDVAEPQIAGPWDVIVDIGAAGVCRTDLHVIEGQWEPIQHPELPYTIGHENAGWVREIGAAVNNVEVGDAVIMHPLTSCGLCSACRVGDDSHCSYATFPGLNADGGMAQQMLTNARAVVKLPDGLEPVEVAALADAGLTAYHSIRKATPVLGPGTNAVVIGAGGLGHIGIQVLKALTATSITVIEKSDDALELARELGADNTIEMGDDDEVVAEVDEFTDGGAQVVFDFVGEGGAEKLSARLLRDGGFHHLIGYGGAIELPTIDMISREISVIGNLVGTYNDLVELMALAARGDVTMTTTTYPLSQANRALEDLDAGKLTGRAILVPDRLES
jgi:NAD+-dependent secondary alcohol dehydrogenase Adh1